jgi:hypothetical protein
MLLISRDAFELDLVATMIKPPYRFDVDVSSRRRLPCPHPFELLTRHSVYAFMLYLFLASLGSKLRTISFHISCFSLGSLNGSHACVALIALSEIDLNTGSSLAFMIVGTFVQWSRRIANERTRPACEESGLPNCRARPDQDECCQTNAPDHHQASFVRKRTFFAYRYGLNPNPWRRSIPPGRGVRSGYEGSPTHRRCLFRGLPRLRQSDKRSIWHGRR